MISVVPHLLSNIGTHLRDGINCATSETSHQNQILDTLHNNRFGPQKKLDPQIKFLLFMALVILSASVERFSVSSMQNFY